MKWTKEQRDAYKKTNPENFAGPDDSYPIKTQGDVQDAWDLAGHAADPGAVRSDIKAIAKRLGLDAPKEGAQFSLGAPTRETADIVYRPGKLFEIGKEFIDRNGLRFGVNMDEAKAAVAGFTKQPIRVFHVPELGILDDAFGNAEKVWIDGNDIMAEFAIPQWLHKHTVGKDIPISSEWDIQAKTIGAPSIVIEPALKDALIKAAFSAHPEAESLRKAQLIAAETQWPGLTALFDRHDTPAGQRALQEIHDSCARYGATCSKSNTAQMASRHEASALQSVHDLTTEHGAVCQSGGNPYRSMSGFSVAPAASAPALPAGGNSMNPIVAAFAKMRAALIAKGTPEAELPTITDADIPAPTAQFSQADLDAAVARATAPIRAQALASQTAQFEAFVDGLIVRGAAAPYEKANLVQSLNQAAADDAVIGGTVQFSRIDADLKPVAATGSRVDAKKAELSTRPPTGLTSELLGSQKPTEADFKAFFAAPSAKTPEQKKAEEDAAVAAELESHGIKKK